MEPQDSTPPQFSAGSTAAAAPAKKRRNSPGNPSPDSEVVALSPRTLMVTNRFVCDVCHKGFQREQNLQLHRRGHNLLWKLKKRYPKDARRRVYVCPEPSCVHHDPSRALGDLTGIKKHYCRKHGEKNLKCDKCNKLYAVESDLKAHIKTCGTHEYRCDCGELFSRRDSFVNHRALCRREMPPMGADLYVGSGSMSPGIPAGADDQIDGFADQAQSSSAAAAAAAAAAQFDFDPIMPLSPGPSVFHSQELGSSSSFFLGGGAISPAQNFSVYGEHSEGAQGSSLLHDEQPFHGLTMQLPQQQHQPGSSNANGNLLMNPEFFSVNGGDSAGGQDPRLVIQDQFNGGGGGNTEYGSAMAPIGSHLSNSFPSLYDGPSPSAGLPQNYATALPMKAAQRGSTSSTTPDGPSALPRAGGFSAAGSGQGASSAAGEMTSYEAHFHDLIMNSLPARRRGFSGSAAWSGAVDDGQRAEHKGLPRRDAAARAPHGRRAWTRPR